MQFTDLLFLFIFLPVLLVAYYVVRGRLRQVVLLFMSLLFYACGSFSSFFGLCLSMLLNLVLVQAIKKCKFETTERKETKQNQSVPNDEGGEQSSGHGSRRAAVLLAIGIVMNVGALVCFKYTDFFIALTNKALKTSFEGMHLIVPLGISFYTFKAVSLLADVYAGRVEHLSFVSVASYLSFFTQIQSGPISRYSEYVAEPRISFSLFSSGVERFMAGFSKKVLLADVLNHIVAEVFDTALPASTPLMWLGSICFSLQLYFDFSGYSDMAIGLTNMLGIRCSENFRYPYATQTIAEFWRRWHMTLGSWFRDYVYIPLGGSKSGQIKLYRNLLVVWLLTGLWHGAGLNFIMWGLGYFVLIAFEKTVRISERLGLKEDRPTSAQKGFRICYRVFALLCINFGWVVFRSPGPKRALANIGNMLLFTTTQNDNLRAAFLLKDYLWFILPALILATPLLPFVQNLCKKKKATTIVYDLLSFVCLTAAFVLALSFIISGSTNPFLYGNF